MPRIHGAAAFLLAAGATVQAGAAAADPAFSLSAGVVHRELVERADSGARLVTEAGELLRLDGAAQRTLAAGGALRAHAAIAAGRLDYAGQTQAGVPLGSDSGHRDLELGAAWRPLAPASWGEAWLTLDALQQRRQIASVPTASGLRETTTLLLAGVRWSHAFDGGGWRWEPSVGLRASAYQRVNVGFGGIFDDANLRGGRRAEAVLALDAGRAGSPWRFGVAWSHARQDASPVQSLYRGGALAGTVREPRIEIDDVLLRASRSF